MQVKVCLESLSSIFHHLAEQNCDPDPVTASEIYPTIQHRGHWSWTTRTDHVRDQRPV